MIDISDGLSSEIMHLCKQSNVGCNLYEDKLPLDPQLINVCEIRHRFYDGSDKRR
jgi:thiamine-monophosphate kinase